MRVLVNLSPERERAVVRISLLPKRPSLTRNRRLKEKNIFLQKIMPSTVVPVVAAGADEINTGRNYDSLTDKMSPSNKPSPTMVHRQSSIVDIFAAGAMVESVAGAVAGTVASGMKGMSAHACNGVSFDNWNVMSDDVKQAVSAVADKVYPPDGIDEALWDHLDDATRAKVREQCNAVVAAKTKRGNVVRFFFDFTSQQASDYYDSR